MKKSNALIQEMEMQEKKEINGGSMNPPSLWQIIRNAIEGIIPLIA